MPPVIQVLFVLAILGFCFFLFQKHAPVASPFKEAIYFVVVMALIYWVLETFEIVHTHVFHWR